MGERGGGGGVNKINKMMAVVLTTWHYSFKTPFSMSLDVGVQRREGRWRVGGKGGGGSGGRCVCVCVCVCVYIIRCNSQCSVESYWPIFKAEPRNCVNRERVLGSRRQVGCLVARAVFNGFLFFVCLWTQHHCGCFFTTVETASWTVPLPPIILMVR